MHVMKLLFVKLLYHRCVQTAAGVGILDISHELSRARSLCWLTPWTPGSKLTVSSSWLSCNLSPILTDICVFLCLGPGRMAACERMHREMLHMFNNCLCVLEKGFCLCVMWECVNVCACVFVCEPVQLLCGGCLCCETETLCRRRLKRRGRDLRPWHRFTTLSGTYPERHWWKQEPLKRLDILFLSWEILSWSCHIIIMLVQYSWCLMYFFKFSLLCKWESLGGMRSVV